MLEYTLSVEKGVKLVTANYYEKLGIRKKDLVHII
jgi:hypothetical protein